MKKLILSSRIHTILQEEGQPSGYISNRGFVLVEGGTIVKENKLVEIVEIATPVEKSASETFRELTDLLPAKLYHPIKVHGLESTFVHRPSVDRVNVIFSGLMSIFPTLAGTSLLDIGSCYGYMSLSFDACGMDVTGIESEERTVAISKLTGTLLKSSASFLHDDILSYLSTTANTFDVVIMARVIHSMIEREPSLSVRQIIKAVSSLAKKVLIVSYPIERIPPVKDPISDFTSWGNFAKVERIGVPGPSHWVLLCQK